MSRKEQSQTSNRCDLCYKAAVKKEITEITYKLNKCLHQPLIFKIIIIATYIKRLTK